jgi:ribosomal protein S3
MALTFEKDNCDCLCYTPKYNPFLGIGFSYAGRVYGAKKAMTFTMLLGSVPFNTLQANIDYAKIMQKTRNGN